MRKLVPLSLICALAFVAACSDGLTDISEPLDQSTTLAMQQKARAVSPLVVDPAGAKYAGAVSVEPSALYKAGGKLVVDDDGADCKKANYTTIQAAVNDAATMPGKDKIEVCAGTYPEDVVIGPNNPVELRGDGVGLTVVTGVPGSSDPIIYATSAGQVDIERLTVDGRSARSGGTTYGIRYDDTDGTIKETEVLNIRNASGSAQGIGIGLRSGSNAKVEKSLVQNYTRVGILVSDAGTSGDVRQNTVNGPLDPRVWAPNGIQISRGGAATAKHNAVDNNPSPNPPGGAGSGIILFCAGPTEATHNNVTDADLGVALADNQDAKIALNTITDSQFDGISLQFIGFFFGGDLGCGITPTAQNEVNHNTVFNSSFDGISLANFDLANAPGTPNGNDISHNNVSDSGDNGIGLYDGTDNVFGHNKIDASGDDGIFVTPAGTGNLFDKNDVEGSGTFSCEDNSVGGGTNGTANTWDKNKGEQPSSPPGICK